MAKLKLTKAERKAKRELGTGNHRAWRKGEQPQHDPKLKVYNFNCEVCQYTSVHRMYVCPLCGNCQNCGGLNLVGEVNQSCRYCGNGEQAAPFDVPTLTAEGQPPTGNPPVEQLDVEGSHNNKRTITTANGTNVTNPHQPMQ